jgi:hypothetical protein
MTSAEKAAALQESNRVRYRLDRPEGVNPFVKGYVSEDSRSIFRKKDSKKRKKKILIKHVTCCNLCNKEYSIHEASVLFQRHEEQADLCLCINCITRLEQVAPPRSGETYL